MSLYGVAVAVWIVGIPIGIGFALKGTWPRTSKEFWGSAAVLWFMGVLWPLTLAIRFAMLILQFLWFVVTGWLTILFRFGGWLGSFFRG